MFGFVGVDPPHRLGVQPRAAVRQVVARDAGHGGVAQLHPHDALGDAARLVGVVVGGLAGVDLAEVAAPRALRAADEEGRLAVLPALVDVGAAGLLADGVQALVLHERVQRLVLGPHLRLGLDPLRLALDGRLRVADLEAQELASLGRDAGPDAAARAHCRTRSRGDPRVLGLRTRRTTVSSTSTGEMSAPTTSLIVVTPASVMPHGMMPRKPASELSQLRAKPCIVTPRCTRTPIAAILSSPSGRRTHTPLRPSTR